MAHSEWLGCVSYIEYDIDVNITQWTIILLKQKLPFDRRSWYCGSIRVDFAFLKYNDQSKSPCCSFHERSTVVTFGNVWHEFVIEAQFKRVFKITIIFKYFSNGVFKIQYECLLALYILQTAAYRRINSIHCCFELHFMMSCLVGEPKKILNAKHIWKCSII